MKTSTKWKAAMGRVASKAAASCNQLKPYALGTALAGAMALPTTALGWDYATVPLFWDTGVKPNVVMMLDDSGSMTALVTNESFQLATLAGTVSSQAQWQFCTGYDVTNKRCLAKSSISTFNASVWTPPGTSNSTKTVGRTIYNSLATVNSCSNSSSGFARTGTSGNPYGICLNNHGLPAGARLTYTSPSTGGSIPNLTVGQTYYVTDVSTHGFRLSATFGGTAITNLGAVVSGSGGSFTFTGLRASANLPSYVNGVTEALCNVSVAPDTAGFYVGVEGTQPWLSGPLPTASQVGVLVSNSSSNPSGSGHKDSCVRWQMTTTQSGTTAPANRDGSATEYDVNHYAEHLLNKLLPSTRSSTDFTNASNFPVADTDPENFVAASDDKVIPNLTRMEAAREAAREVVKVNSKSMQIGIASFKSASSEYYGEINADCGASDATLIGGGTNVPMQATGDGVIGALVATHFTPLARSLLEISQYFEGRSASMGGTNYSSKNIVKYRCQKNYAVLMTDGDPTEDDMVRENIDPVDTADTTRKLADNDSSPPKGWDGINEDTGYSGSGCSSSSPCTWLDDIAQYAYDGDFKTTGTDSSGKSFNDTTNGGQWAKQNIVTYTVGFGLENDILKRTPLTNTVSVTTSDVVGNAMKIPEHGLNAGDYVLVISKGASSLTQVTSDVPPPVSPTASTNDGRYYAAPVSNESLKLALTEAKAKTCAAGTTADCVSISPGNIVLRTGPGQSFFAFTPEQLASSLSAVFNEIRAITASASAVAVNAKSISSVGGSPYAYQASFDTKDWSGKIVAYEIKQDLATGGISVDLSDEKLTTVTTLDHPSKMGTLLTWNRDTVAPAYFGTAGVAPTTSWAGLSTWQKDGLGSFFAMDWIRGYRKSTDYTPALAIPSQFRDASTSGLLGDIINADPVYVQATNFGYNRLPPSPGGDTCSGTSCTGAETYLAYYNANRKIVDGTGTVVSAGRTPMLYVGANDGMLHAFKANDLTQVMGYLPDGVFRGHEATPENKMYNMTRDNYDHRYFVDGDIFVGDAYVGGNWKTYLLGGLASGGKSAYLLDITNPGSFTTSNVMWEATSNHTKFPNLGYTYGMPVIARFPDNKWYAIFPNGPDGADNQSHIYVVPVGSGTTALNATVQLNTGEGGVATPNGMMSVQVELDEERTVVAIYGGDLRGNIWRFDVTAGGASTTGKKIFTATDGTNPQPITGGLRLGSHPDGGTLVYFGTGKYFEKEDKVWTTSSKPIMDSFYAVWDKGGAGSPAPAITPADLAEQVFTTTTVSGHPIRTVGTDAVDYNNKKGWFINLLNNGSREGERVVTTPLLYASRIIFVSMVPAGGDLCTSTGFSWLNELDALNGTQLPEKILDTNGDGKLDGDDQLASAVQLEGLASAPTIVEGQKNDSKVLGTTSQGNSILTVQEKKGNQSALAGGRGRMSWQQLQ